MLIFDTHCHLADEKYEKESKEEIIKRAKKKGIKYILNVGEGIKTNEIILKQIKKYDCLFGAFGIHPNNNEDLNENNLRWIEENIKNDKIIAVGEIGLDYYRKFTDKEKQKIWFEKQLLLAKKFNLPVLLHIRNAFEDSYKIIEKNSIKKGLLHCFTGNLETLKKFLEMGFYISFSGNITYGNLEKRKEIIEIINFMPLDKILIETDSPYLSPEPFRGKKNYPENIIYTLKEISIIKKISIKKISIMIFANSLKLFKLNLNF